MDALSQVKVHFNIILLVCPFQELILTWGVDGKVCVWDAASQGVVTSPICTLVSKPDFPVYALDYCTNNKAPDSKGCLVIGGGSSDGGFLGVPLYLYDI